MHIALLFYLLGSVGVFFQHNLQFINDWWKDRHMFNVLIFSIPIGYCYIKSWTYFVQTLGTAWSARFLFFGLSYMIFPVLAYTFLNESPWTAKTILSTLLSVFIIIIQYKL